MWCEKLPLHLAGSNTIFIPKKGDASGPGDFRPISISSALTRLLHRVLAQRIDKYICLDDQQRAFRLGIDGCRDNTVLLDTLLRRSYNSYKSIFLATLDLAKAFDSVDHTAIMEAARAAGITPPMLRYIEHLYTSSSTTLSGGGWKSAPLRVTRGVKLGDFLSPVIFNIVIDHLLRSLSPDCGTIFNGTTVRAITFADDLVLLPDSAAGLQHLLDQTASFLSQCGLSVNNAKCHSLSIFGDGHRKLASVGPRRSFTINGRAIKALTREDNWTYPGIEY